jgi:hypothetical protein
MTLRSRGSSIAIPQLLWLEVWTLDDGVPACAVLLLAELAEVAPVAALAVLPDVEEVPEVIVAAAGAADAARSSVM